MFNRFQNIQINGEHYTVDNLNTLCAEKISDPKIEIWEKEIFLFLQDWFSPSDIIAVSTSGSTGSPKTINLQKKHMIASALATLHFFNLKKDDSAWLCLPVDYIAGKMMIVRSIVGKLNLIYSEPDSLPTIIYKHKIDLVAMVPNQVFGLLDSDQGVQQLSNINNLLIGGSGISDDLERRLMNIHDIVAWHSYGMTETITHIALRKISKDVEVSCFNTLPGIQIRTNADNQLIIDAPALGVVNMVTNDIASITGEGSFLITGRIDNVVISGGIKFYPEIIERKINNFISDCYFIGGIPDNKLGEKLILFIEGKPVGKKRSDLLMNEIRKKTGKFETPKKIVHVEEFIRTETGKLKRREIINNYLGHSN